MPLTVLSVAHPDDEERALVLSVVLEHVPAWVRGLSGTSALRGLVVFDEVSGYAPPQPANPANPATKRPLLGLMKQARAGVDAKGLSARVKVLAPRWFVMRDVLAGDGVKLVQTRWTLAWMREPMTRRDIARLR